tara:strand:+ start:70991 stop:71971 length:981 start_codon:yes stop_codon:yes gene_type:complete
LKKIIEIFPKFHEVYFLKGRMALESYLSHYKDEINTVYIPSLTCKAIPNAMLKIDIPFEYYDVKRKDLIGDLESLEYGTVIIQGTLGILPKYSKVDQLMSKGLKVILDLSQCLYIDSDYFANIQKFEFIFTSFQKNKPLGKSQGFGGVGLFKNEIPILKEKPTSSVFSVIQNNLIDILPSFVSRAVNHYIFKDDFYIDRDKVKRIDELKIHSEDSFDLKFFKEFYRCLESSELKIDSTLWSGYYLPIYVKDKKNFLKKSSSFQSYNWPIRILSPFHGDLKDLMFPDSQIENARYFAEHLMAMIVPKKDLDKKNLLEFIQKNKNLFL